MSIVKRVLDTVARMEGFPAEAQLDKQLAQPTATHAYVQITSLTKTSDRYPGKFRLYDASAKTWSDGADVFGGLCWVVTPNGEALATGREYEGRLWDFVGPAAATTRPTFIVSIPTGDPVKCWVKFSATGGSITVNKSFNVDTVTRTALGDYTVNFLKDFESAHYSINGIVATSANVLAAFPHTLAAGSARIQTYSLSAVLTEADIVMLSFHGNWD